MEYVVIFDFVVWLQFQDYWLLCNGIVYEGEVVSCFGLVGILVVVEIIVIVIIVQLVCDIGCCVYLIWIFFVVGICLIQ